MQYSLRCYFYAARQEGTRCWKKVGSGCAGMGGVDGLGVDERGTRIEMSEQRQKLEERWPSSSGQEQG